MSCTTQCTALVALTLLALEDKQSSAPALEPTLRSRFYVYPHTHTEIAFCGYEVVERRTQGGTEYHVLKANP